MPAKLFLFAALALASGICLAQSNSAGTGSPKDSGVFKPADSVVLPAKDDQPRAFNPVQISAPSAIPTSQIGRDYRFRPNDLLEVEVFEMESLKRTTRVNAMGMVSLPLIGPVAVGGLTSSEAEALIAARYSEKYLQSPNVSIFVKEFTVDRITIEGAVGRPGVFALSEKMTLLRALALAGGFGPIANTSEVMVFRINDNNEREVAVFDVEKIRSGKGEDPSIKGDDLIVVQRDKTRALLKDSVFRDIVDSINPFSFLVR